MTGDEIVLNGAKLLDILRTGGDLNDTSEIFECSQEQPRRGLRRKIKKDEARAFEYSQALTPIDWSSVKPLPPVEDAETFSPMKNGDCIELCDVKTGARYMAKIIDVKIED